MPYFGACMHSPRPPASQIVYVMLSTPKPLCTLDTVWVSGKLKTTRQDSPATAPIHPRPSQDVAASRLS